MQLNRPYFFFESAFVGLMYSIGVTSFVLLLFGGFKTYYSGAEVGLNGYLWGCLSTLFVGGAAAGASFAIVKAMDGFA
jgi:VIT1/CCC1 family predicted Fe2+/Mn2+ transporter